MAKVWANSAFNFDKYNLAAFIEDHDANGVERRFDFPTTVHGVTYDSRYDFTYYGGTVTIAGDDLLFIDEGEYEDNPIVEGTVRALAGPVTGDGSNANTGFEGLSVPLMDLFMSAFGQTDQLRALLGRELSGADRFDLSSSADLARGFGGNDVMNGKGGSDRLFGDAGDDKLFGGAGADRLMAGKGKDLLVGAAGKDVLIGGTDSAADTFDFNSRSDSGTGTARDVIQNFTTKADDIDLRDIDARGGTDPDDAFAWHNQTAAKNAVWWTKAGDDVVLHADVTGDAKADFQIMLDGVSSLGQGDVLL
ncbi:calcium-binding protein [Rubellimicrobium roseum]|uniref:Uncharacterized protein n=1 Tax=Rubellimicrobium roseum TaxID=687525 RepID=A0A5C4NB66_9RHOB|nr:M10 family metallopeptidase C-terminal domain-containing protein [Rubellimicrobium roseum]TNC65983.1 hypothetical protein FHG71_17095 [Rubellimicrobium roseum]